MSWAAAIPAAALTLAWVLLPGLAMGYALGLRGITAWGVAPVGSIGSIAVAAVVAGSLGVPWSPAIAIVPAVVFAGTALVVAGVGRSRRGHRAVHVGDLRLTAAGASVGMVGAAVIGVVTAMRGIGRPDAISQTYDAVFHYNAVAEILATGNASSLAVGTLVNPSAATAFYPAAWHDLVSLVVLTAGASLPLASNIVAIVVAAVVWPLSCVVLARQIFGRSAAAALVTPVVAVGLIAFPWALMSFGVLWPNLVGLALVPACLAAVVALCDVATDVAMSRPQALVLVSLSVVVLGLAHPNALFSAALLTAAPLLWWLVARVRLLVHTRRWWLGVATVGLAAAAAAGSLYTVVVSPIFAGVRSYDWPAYQSPAQAAGEIVLNATNHQDAAWAVSLVIVVGLVAAVRDRITSWLVPAHLSAAALFILASSMETPVAAAFTGVWYNDPYRLAAIIPITAVPLAVCGLLAAGRWAADGLGTASEAPRRLLSADVLAVVATSLLVLLSSGMYVRDHATFLAEAYPRPTVSDIVTPAQLDFFAQVAGEIPPDAVVAQNPWNGSPLLWATTGRDVLFPHMDGSWTPDQLYLANNLDEVATDPEVCAAANRLQVDFLFVNDRRFWPHDPRTELYPGLDRPTGPGFERVASDGHGNVLYRITACDTTQGTAHTTEQELSERPDTGAVAGQ